MTRRESDPNVTMGPRLMMHLTTGAVVAVGSFKAADDVIEQTFATLDVCSPDGSAYASVELRLCDVEVLTEELRSIFDEVEQ